MTVKLTLDNKDLAKTYDEVSNSQFNNGRVLIEKLKIKTGDSILDIGSGTGRLGWHVIDIIGPTGSYLGIDPLEERIKIANTKNTHPNAVFKIGNAEDLNSVADSTIDVVYLNSVFHWVLNKEVALAEIFRVLKPEGKVGITTTPKELHCVSEVNVITDKVLKRDPYNKAVCLEDSTHHQHGLTTTALIQLLTKAGFKVTDAQIKEVTRQYSTAEEVTKFTEASCFGNYLNHVPDSLREQAKLDIEVEFEKHRTKDGIQFSGHMIFAVAQKG
jgi:ubiquinone/menaquinone biosynthesis C-methylase UbiE